MNRKKLLITLVLFPIFLISELAISAEINLEEVEQSGTISTINYDNYDMLIVDISNDYASYKSIQEAIEASNANSTIYVKKGVYNEIVSICKPIKLIGEDKTLTFIRPESNKNGFAVKIAATGVKLIDFSICNDGSGLYTTGVKIIAPNTIVESCNIFDTPVGIAVWSSNNILSNCTFSGCNDEGVVLLGSSTNSGCKNNLVTNCEFYGNCDGIELQYSSNNVISNCNFYNNSHAGIDAIGSSNNNNLISNCILYDNDVFGIYLSRSSENQITSCSIDENQIMMYNVEKTLIEDSEIENIYLVNADVSLKNCKRLTSSSIKAINSDYSIDNVESIEKSFEENQVGKGFFISNILNFIRNQLEAIKVRIYNR